jgi:hypothetical protein
MTSVTTGRPVRSRASARSRSPSRPSPWNEYGLVRGGRGDRVGGLEELIARFHGARTRHHGERAVADASAEDLDDGVLGVELPRRELEGSTDRRHGLHPRQRREPADEHVLARPDLAEGGDDDPLDPLVLVRCEPLREDEALHADDLVFGGIGRHHDEHVTSSFRKDPGQEKKQRSRTSASPGTTRDPGPRLRARSCRAGIEVDRVVPHE